MSKDISGVPDQVVGGSHDNTAERCFDTSSEAKDAFQILESRFLDICRWQEYMGKMGAEFTHMDLAGNVVHRHPIVGDFIRIDMPGPKNVAGDGYDWVKIVEVDKSPYDVDDRILIRSVPTVNPKSDDSDAIAHFYTSRASSTFIISRNNLCLKTEVYGRNEITNKDVDYFMDKFRNKMISVGGSIGLSKLQWESFAKSLLDF